MTVRNHEDQVEEVCEEVSNVLDRMLAGDATAHNLERQQISIEALSRAMTYIAATLGRDHLPEIERYLVKNTEHMIEDVRAIIQLEAPSPA